MTKNKAKLQTIHNKSLTVYQNSQTNLKTQKNGRLLVWNGHENLIYAQFLAQHELLMLTQRSRRRNKIFTILSNILKTRNPDQCRSHHQKMMITHKTQKSIIIYIRKKYKISLQVQKDLMERIQQVQSQSQNGLNLQTLGFREQITSVQSIQGNGYKMLNCEQSIWDIFQDGILRSASKN